jgi:hypothetical protein
VAGSVWHGRPHGPVEAPNPLLAARTHWQEIDVTDPVARALQAAALEILAIALRDERDRERRLAAIGRTLLLPKEEQIGHTRCRALLDALSVLHDVHRRFTEG